MGDLEVKTDEIWDPGPERCQAYPSSSYQGLAVNDSSDIHVGTKYVADKIVFVLPKSGSAEVPDIQRFTTEKHCFIKTSQSKSKYSFKTVTVLLYVSFTIVFFIGVSIYQLYVFNDDIHNPLPLVNTTNEDVLSDLTTSTETENVFSTFLTTEAINISTFFTTNETTTTTVTQPSKILCTHVIPNTTTTNVPNNNSQSNFIILKSVIPRESTMIDESEYLTSTTMSANTSELIPCPYLDYQCKGDFPDERYRAINNASIIVVNVTRVADGVCLVRRSSWGGSSCDSCGTFKPVNSVVIHFIERCDSSSKCSSLMRNYENNFATSKTDFLYNFVIGGDCRIYEGVGWDGVGDKGNIFHVGVQMMEGFYVWHNTICDKQLYNLMLLMDVGRWCGKIKSSFSLYFKYELGIACDSKCKDNFSGLNNILFLKFDKYFMNSDSYFVRDSIALGKLFSACDEYQFQTCYSLCTNSMCTCST